MSAFKLQLTYSKAFVFSDRIRPYTDADYTHRFRRTSQELGKAILHAFPPLVLRCSSGGSTAVQQETYAAPWLASLPGAPISAVPLSNLLRFSE